jgi:nickel-type superoxide dismutase maturation protease
MRPATLLFRVAVTGPSMEPTVREGDWLLVRQMRRQPRVGELVIAADPRDPARLLVKRVSAVSGDQVTVIGDRPERSTDSRDFGALPSSAILGRPLLRYAPLERIGLVR